MPYPSMSLCTIPGIPQEVRILSLGDVFTLLQPSATIQSPAWPKGSQNVLCYDIDPFLSIPFPWYYIVGGRVLTIEVSTHVDVGDMSMHCTAIFGKARQGAVYASY